MIAIATFCLSTASNAQTNPALPVSLSHRYLLIVETSRTMNHRWQGVSAAIQELLDAGLNAESRPGDTLRVWTFSADVQTNLFSQVELPFTARPGFGSQLINFVQAQPAGSRAALEKVIPGVNFLIRETDFATVILITAGESELRGTPFDGQVNQAFRRWQDEQKKARMPFVTVLRAAHGKFTHCSITPAQWPLELPPFPMELRFVPAKPPVTVPVEAPKKLKDTAPPQWAAVSAPTNKVAISKPSEEIARPITSTSAPRPAEKRAEIASTAPSSQTTKPAIPSAPLNSNSTKLQKPPTTISPAASLPPNWQPFDSSLPDWLALERLPVPPAAALPEIKQQSAAAKPITPALVVSAVASKSIQRIQEPVKPFGEELVDLLASSPMSSISASGEVVIETAKAPSIRVPSPPSPNIQREEQLTAATHSTIFIVNAPSAAKDPLPGTLAVKSQPSADKPESASKETLVPRTPAVALAHEEDVIPQVRARSEVVPVSEPISHVFPSRSPVSAATSTHVRSADSGPSSSIALLVDTTDAGSKFAEGIAKELPSSAGAEVAHARPNFFRENGGLLAASLLAAVAAIFCFVNWLRSFIWPMRSRPAIPDAAFALLPEPKAAKEIGNASPKPTSESATKPSFTPIDLPFDLPPLRKPKRLDPIVISETAHR